MTKLKPKKCKQCGKEFEPSRPLQPCCSSECSYNYIIKLKEKKQAKEKREAEKKRKLELNEMREKLKTANDYRKELQLTINTIVREIDRGCGCISSGRVSGQMQAGHFYSVGGWPALRFNLMNIWLQSATDNNYLSGNSIKYRLKMQEIGLIDFLDSLPTIYPELKLNATELKEKAREAKLILKSIPKLDRPRTFDERIELRKQINNQLNIYTL